MRYRDRSDFFVSYLLPTFNEPGKNTALDPFTSQDYSVFPYGESVMEQKIPFNIPKSSRVFATIFSPNWKRKLLNHKTIEKQSSEGAFLIELGRMRESQGFYGLSFYYSEIPSAP